MEWIVMAVVLIAGFLGWARFARSGGMPGAGDTAPDFALPDQNDKVRTLTEFRGRWLALYFFPRADTPG